MRSIRLAPLAALVLALIACEPAAEPARPIAPAEAAEPVPAPPPPLDAPWVDPVLPAPTSGRFDATEVRVAWAGAALAGADVTRDEPAARVLARTLLREAAAGSDLVAIAKASSDAPSGARGGRIGTFEAGTFDAAIEAAIASVAEGGLAPLVRTDAGYHLLRRERVDEVQVAWAVWAWTGARGAHVRRTREQAAQLAAAGADALRAGAPPSSTGADVASPDAGERLGRAQWAPLAESTAFALAPGAVSDPIALPTGFLVVARR